MRNPKAFTAVFLAGLALVFSFYMGVGVQAQSTHESSQSVSPAAEALEVTPSDVTVLSPPCRSLFVGTAGDVAVDMQRTGTAITYVAPGGVVLPVRVSKVLATGTTASDIVCLY